MIFFYASDDLPKAHSILSREIQAGNMFVSAVTRLVWEPLLRYTCEIIAAEGLLKLAP
jgi:hypothetical protein